MTERIGWTGNEAGRPGWAIDALENHRVPVPEGDRDGAPAQCSNCTTDRETRYGAIISVMIRRCSGWSR